jgi:uncharacterized Zn-binding protein involved in type VI secretion
VGSAVKGNSALGAPSIEDKIAEKAMLDDYEKQIKQLDRSNAVLRKALEKDQKQAAQKQAAGQGKTRHIAHAEGWQAVCTAPDYCRVGKDIVAFNSFAALDEKQTASSNVKARGTSVYRKGDVIKNVQSDAGQHIVSGTSLGRGHVKILEGHENVKVNGVPVARHDSRCLINCDASGVGGAPGKLVTEEKDVGGGSSPGSISEVPPGDRTSEKLEALKKARAAVASEMTNLNAVDEFVNFQQSNEFLDEVISQISGPSGSGADYAAQVARGLLGFTKDVVMGVGELAYEGVKAVPKFARLTRTQSGQLSALLDAKILAENIRLGNITPISVGGAALSIGKAIVKPITDPWAKGAHVESVTRGVSEVATLALGWLKGSKVVKAANLVDAGALAVAKTAHLPTILKPAGGGSVRGAAPSVSTGVHIKLGRKPSFSGNWKNYSTHGIKTDPMLSSEGRRMVQEFEKKGLNRDEAIQEATDLIKTGSSMPLANPIAVGDKFYKIIPEGGSTGPNSAFWATREEVRALEGLSYDQIADKLGVPLVSQQGAKFQVMEISAIRNSTSFTSVIAPTTELGANGAIWSQSGGGLQTLLVDRSAFSSPVPTKIKIP